MTNGNPALSIPEISKMGAYSVLSFILLWGLFYTVPGLAKTFRDEQESQRKLFTEMVDKRDDRTEARFQSMLTAQKELTKEISESNSNNIAMMNVISTNQNATMSAIGTNQAAIMEQIKTIKTFRNELRDHATP